MGRNAAMAVQHRQQHGQPVLIEAQGHAARVGHVAIVHQRLYFNQHRPCPFPSGHYHAARDFFLSSRQEDRRRIGDFFQAFVGHAKHAQFVDRAETVFNRAQQT